MKSIILFTVMGVFFGNCHSQSSCRPAVDFLLEKYKKYNIIAIDEGPHGTIEAHQFLRSLIQNEKLSKTIQYIIIEFGNVEYQSTLDRYISGEPVPIQELQKVWRETTGAHTPLFERPVYIKLLETVRNINLALPAYKKIRVLASDPKVDWKKINTINDFFSNLSQRDVLPSQLAIKYGIDSAKKVLILFGGAHLSKISDEKRDSTHWNIPYFINRKYSNSILSIGLYITKIDKSQLKIHNLPLNSICDISTDSLGNREVKYDFDPEHPHKLKDLYDAVYYIGPSDNWHEDAPGLIDSVYWEELNRRSKIVWGGGIDPKLQKRN